MLYLFIKKMPQQKLGAFFNPLLYNLKD